eukprot:PITA_16683
MGYIYEIMDQEKEQLQTTYKDRLAKYGCIWEIIDNKWNNQLHHPIHAVGYFLNQKYHYKAWLGDLQDGEVRARLIDCLECMVPSHANYLEIHRQLTLFSTTAGPFGKILAKMERDVDRLAHWWESFGDQCPQLQKFAIRVLSQTCNASGCERNWRNQMMNKTPNLDPIMLDDIDPTSEWVEETKDPVFYVDFDIDMALAGDEADLVAPSEPG